MAKKNKTTHIRKYFINAPTAAGYGIFVTLILGVILTYLSRLPYLGFLDMYGSLLRHSGVIGCAIGAAVALSIDADRMAVFTSAAVGALAYNAGGPVATIIAVIAGAEIGTLLSGRTKLDVMLVPMATLIAGGVVAGLIGGPISYLMGLLGRLIMGATELHPAIMGMVIAVVVGLLCSSPISAVVVCTSLGISGVAAGAATVGCCVHTLGFATVGFWDNGLEGLISHGLGATTFQAGNIIRRPLIVFPEIIVSAILGPVATTFVVIENTALAAGMGTGGFVGVIGAFEAMVASGEPASLAALKAAIMLVVAPILLTFLVGLIMKKQVYIKKGEMTIYKI